MRVQWLFADVTNRAGAIRFHCGTHFVFEVVACGRELLARDAAVEVCVAAVDVNDLACRVARLR